jgi:hypothetical protein
MSGAYWLDAGPRKEASMVGQQSAAEVKNRHSAELLALPHVVGVGTAKGEDGSWVIEVHVDDPAGVQLAPTLDGVQVRLVHDGPFFAGPARDRLPS